MNAPPSIALLACSVFEQEIALLSDGARHVAQTRFFEIGLHDHPDNLRKYLQEAVDELDARTDIDAIVLAYGLCGCGTAGLATLRHKLVIPRAHDCVAIFMGSKEQYAERQRVCPGCYYYSPGWNRARRVPGPDRIDWLRRELAGKFDEDNIEFLLECEHEQWAAHNTAVYLNLGTADADAEAAYARQCAEWLGWRFERIDGDPALLRDLIWGNWDARRFQIVEPGSRLANAANDLVVRADPVPGTLEKP